MVKYRKLALLGGAFALAGSILVAGEFGDGAQAQSAGEPGASAPAGAEVSDNEKWVRFSGWKRYHANCSVCHGPDGLGGTFAPSLSDSLKTLDHEQFMEVVVNGKENAELAMPSFGADPNVMCYIEDIYTYLKARSDGQMGRGRPTDHPSKPADFAEAENACMGT